MPNANPEISTLVNAFQAGLRRPWAISKGVGGDYTTLSGNLTITVPANAVSAYMQTFTYSNVLPYHGYVYFDLTESSVLLQVNAGTQHATLEVWAPQLIDLAGHWFGWHITNGQLQVSYQGAIRASATYSTTTHAWLRIRETQGTTYFDYSADGMNWTNLYSVADSADQFCLAGVYVNLYIGSNSSGTNPAGSATFDNFNFPVLPAQVPTYALNGSNLPAPTASATTVSFIDVNGETWVARNTANAGNGVWRRARDVLHTKITRSATLPMVASPGAVIAFDQVLNDNFGLYLGSPWYGFRVPVVGWYEVLANLQVSVAVANTFIQGQIQQNTGVSNGTVVNWSSDNCFSARASGGLLWRSTALMYLAANDIVNLKASQQQLYSITAGDVATRFCLDYLGTG